MKHKLKRTVSITKNPGSTFDVRDNMKPGVQLTGNIMACIGGAFRCRVDRGGKPIRFAIVRAENIYSAWELAISKGAKIYDKDGFLKPEFDTDRGFSSDKLDQICTIH